MRVNIYHHEIPIMEERGAEHVETVADDTGERFHGIRFYTEPPVEHMPGDDDSSAVTFWVPWTKAEGHQVAQLRGVFAQAIALLDYIEMEQNK